ncbi:MAG: hypothetical protein C0624_11170 [Desulfuromonas sp.]|nr:MAG: hypothetical protein C0624_11170 [Desulfuromonas sp.]
MTRPSFNRQRLPSLCLTLALFFTTACSATLPPPESPVPLGDTFSSSGTQQALEQWWQAFDDPALARLIDRALKDNFDLQATWERLAQSRASVRNASSGLWPQLDAEAGARRTRSATEDTTSFANSFSLGAVASYELDLWGRVRATREAAQLAQLANRENLDTAAMSLAAEVAGTWFELTTASGQQQILSEQHTTAAKTLELVELQFRTGKVTLADLLQQRQLLESIAGEQAQAAARVAVTRHSLAVLTGQSPQSFQLPDTQRLPALPPLPATGLPAELLSRRPDIRSAWYQVLADRARIDIAQADRLPRISLSGSIESSADEIDTLFDNWFANLAGNLLAPLLDGGQRRAEVSRTREAAAESLNLYGQQVLEALQEVEDALVHENHQQQYLLSLQQQLELSQQALNQIRTRYTRGNLSFERVLDAQRSVLQLQRSELEAESQLLQYRVALYRALGGNWPLQQKPSPRAANDEG